MATTDELAAQIEALTQQIPTLEDLLVSTTIPCWRASGNPATFISGSTALTLLVAPIPLRVLSVALSFEYMNLAASDTNYWRAELNRGSGASFTVFATRSTQNTGANAGGGIAQRRAWTFDAAAWSPSDLNAGDLLRVTFTPVGNPAEPIGLPMTVTIRYRPL